MKRVPRRLRPLAWPAAIAVAYLVLLGVLVAVGAVQQVLGAVRPNLFLLAALLVLYVLRLVTLFVVPGWIVVAVGVIVLRVPKAPDVERDAVDSPPTPR